MHSYRLPRFQIGERLRVDLIEINGQRVQFVGRLVRIRQEVDQVRLWIEREPKVYYWVNAIYCSRLED